MIEAVDVDPLLEHLKLLGGSYHTEGGAPDGNKHEGTRNRGSS